MASEGNVQAATTLRGMLEEGRQPAEGELVRYLRSPACPGSLIEVLAGCPWVLRLRRLLPLMLRHPACPRPFAWDVLPRLGWNDLLQVARDPRTAPAIMRQAERKLAERLPQLTVGERAAVARRAPRGVVAALLGDPAAACVHSLLDNPAFTEADAIRLLHANRNPECLLAVVHHPRWGASTAVAATAVHSGSLPLGVALGLAAALPARELAELVHSEDVRGQIRDAVRQLLEHRRQSP